MGRVSDEAKAQSSSIAIHKKFIQIGFDPARISERNTVFSVMFLNFFNVNFVMF